MMEPESDLIYFSTQFWNDAGDEIPKKNFDIIHDHINQENETIKKLIEYLNQRYSFSRIWLLKTIRLS